LVHFILLLFNVFKTGLTELECDPCSYNCKHTQCRGFWVVDSLTFVVDLGGLEGHVSRDCTMETKPKSCYKCGQEGHIVRGIIFRFLVY
jgi:hypothetical protein